MVIHTKTIKTMKKHIALAALVTIFTLYFTSQATANTSQPIPKSLNKNFGEIHYISSKILDENRELLIHLPDSYSSSTISYPVLFVLDGDSHFKHAVLASDILQASGKIPALIIVGIPNNTGQRMRDAYDASDKFLAFITQEAVPYLKNKFRALDMNTLFGHSAMGTVTLTTKLTTPQTFENLIASSAALGDSDKELIAKLANSIKSAPSNAIYFSVGQAEREGKGFSDSAHELAKRLNSSNALNWTFEQHPRHNHTSAAYIALYQGLAYAHQDYEGPALKTYQEFKTFGGLDALNKFYQQRGKKYGDNSQIPIHVITGLAFAFYGENKIDRGIELLNKTVSNYRDASRIYGALGFLYEQKKNTKAAKSSYQKALDAVIKNNGKADSRAYYQSKVEQLTTQIESN